MWLTDIEGTKPRLRVYVDGECVFTGEHASVPSHGEILRQPLEGSALVISMEKSKKGLAYSLTWDGRAYQDDLAMLKDKSSSVDMSDSFNVRLKAMEVKMEDAPVKEGSTQMKSTAFFTIIANLYTTKAGSKTSKGRYISALPRRLYFPYLCSPICVPFQTRSPQVDRSRFALEFQPTVSVPYLTCTTQFRVTTVILYQT